MIVSHLSAICCQGRLDWVCVPWCVFKMEKPHKTQLVPKVSLLLFLKKRCQSFLHQCCHHWCMQACHLNWNIFKAEFTQLFAVMRSVPKVPSAQRGFAELLKSLVLVERDKILLPVNSGKCHNQLFRKVHRLGRNGDGYKRNTFFLML